MAKKKQNKARTTVVWSSKSKDAIQLYRDIFFGKYPTGTPPRVVYTDPSREYSKYSAEGFSRQYRTAVKKIDTFKALGSGLDDDFRASLQLHIQPQPEDQAANIPADSRSKRGRSEDDDEEEEEDYEEDIDKDDEDYKDEEEEDIHIDLEGIEDKLSKLSVSGAAKTTRRQSTAKAAADVVIRNVDMPIVQEGSPVPLHSPQLVQCQGGVLAGYVPMYTGVDYEFSISENRKQIVQRLFIPDTFLSATKVFYRHGLSQYNVYIAGVQENIDTQKKKVKVSEGGDRVYHEMILYNLPFEIEPSFYDEKGTVIDKVFEGKGPRGLLWAFFYLKKKVEVEKTPKAAGFDRDNKRDNDNNSDGYGYRNVQPNIENRSTPLQPNTFFNSPSHIQSPNAAATATTSNSQQQMYNEMERLRKIEAQYIWSQQAQVQAMNEVLKTNEEKIAMEQKKHEDSERKLSAYHQNQLHEVAKKSAEKVKQQKSQFEEQIAAIMLETQRTQQADSEKKRVELQNIINQNLARLQDIETRLSAFLNQQQHVTNSDQQRILDFHVATLQRELEQEQKRIQEQEQWLQDEQYKRECEEAARARAEYDQLAKRNLMYNVNYISDYGDAGTGGTNGVPTVAETGGLRYQSNHPLIDNNYGGESIGSHRFSSSDDAASHFQDAMSE